MSQLRSYLGVGSVAAGILLARSLDDAEDKTSDFHSPDDITQARSQASSEDLNDCTVVQLPCLVKLENPVIANLANLWLRNQQKASNSASAHRASPSQRAQHLQTQAIEDTDEEYEPSQTATSEGSEPQAAPGASLNFEFQEAAEAVNSVPANGGTSFDKAADHAAAYQEDIQQILKDLENEGVHLPADRFTENHTEIWRFANTLGLTTVQSSSEREGVRRGTVERIKEAVAWLHVHDFVSEAVLQKFAKHLYWIDKTTSGYPALVIEVGQATRDYSKRELLVFAEAIISQVQKALQDKFSDQPGSPEQMLVIAHCQGASALKAKSLLTIIKHVSLVLNRHYPGRLHKFYVVDAPNMMRWPVKALVALGHQSTRQKVVLCASNDPDLLSVFPW